MQILFLLFHWKYIKCFFFFFSLTKHSCRYVDASNFSWNNAHFTILKSSYSLNSSCIFCAKFISSEYSRTEGMFVKCKPNLNQLTRLGKLIRKPLIIRFNYKLRRKDYMKIRSIAYASLFLRRM